MNPVLFAGTIIVIFALLSYTVSTTNEQRSHKVTNKVLVYLTIGFILDLTATICMITGSINVPFTIHGIMGYSALLGMLIETIKFWKLRVENGINAQVPLKLHLYSRYIYIWWVLTFISGTLTATSY